MKLTLAAAAATAAASFVCASAFARVGAKHERKHFKVPPEILEGGCECREEVILAVRLALAGK